MAEERFLFDDPSSLKGQIEEDKNHVLDQYPHTNNEDHFQPLYYNTGIPMMEDCNESVCSNEMRQNETQHSPGIVYDDELFAPSNWEWIETKVHSLIPQDGLTKEPMIPISPIR